ncbi:M3 family metallopeptidase [Kaistia dalseonensis]|uniref:Peptidyl-dipeptidase Dcp n=1 Tax=Kaistia dalseonensis TaxID=410840 RepID=A0ABU0HEY6_9HYPH|nr:M3 family metallopeptidase [Kaistia dalseonensis]MCX5497661.1 M3 family metallopeptidase [Kaistia dalseonensis]MDQ0440305.1 peptidyl-dipeptidase Dcp [Kaistia dalseonensis]
MTSDNPLLQPWTTPFGIAPFAEIETKHYKPAFEAGIAEHEREIATIIGNPEAPTFANTIEAMERAGRTLDRVGSVFFNLTGANTNDELEAIALEIAPILSRHRSAIYLNDALFARVDALFKGDQSGLDAEQQRVLERYHIGFVRSGAGLPAASKERLAAISERLATLGTNFGQNVLADEKSWSLVLEEGDDLAGLPDFLKDAASEAARARGLDGQYVITLSRSSIEPFLQFSARRDLREKAFAAWIARGEAGKTDNRGIIAETVALRAEEAKLLGFKSFAHFRLDDSMARTPEAAMGLLRSVWTPARERAIEEREALQALVRAEGGNFEIAAWDWRFYSEKRRKAEFDLDESQLKPYLQLDKVIEAAFDTASKLFGVTFTERFDVPAYHPDVRVFEVKNAAGAPVGLFLGDYFARPSKRSGAWMSDYRGQERLIGDIRPIIVNVMNFAKAADGQPTLLSYDDARTLFHEFGHGLHGLLSDVTYPSLAGTSVARDFVEFPSQLYEHWFERPEILERFAVHYQTGEPMPAALLERLQASRTFNQGFATVEYVSSALVDLELHLLDKADGLDSTAFEKKVLEEIGMPEAMVMRHRTPHFQHVFAGDGYSSAYYSYLWSETLDADGFGAFEEAGDIFAPDVAAKLYTFVYSAGNRRKPDEAYRAFRGRDPDPSALLRKRGLAEGD